jgi:CRISPR-associated protein Cas1
MNTAGDGGMENNLNFAPDAAAWTERSAFWYKRTSPKTGRFERRAGFRDPLILSGHGVRLRVDRGSLSVHNGFTHYPQSREVWRFFPGDWRLPSRIVVLDVDGSLSFDALSWLATHDVPLVHINWRGEVVNVVGGSGHGEISPRVKSRLAARAKDGGLGFSLSLIKGKITNSIDTLREAFPKSAAIDQAIHKLKDELASLKSNPPSSISQLMGAEGRVGYTYFDAWRTCSLKWKGLDRRPIPDDWHRVGRRSSKLGNPSHPNRNATHPVNAILNYSYGILESQVRMQVMAAGFDPIVGFMHGSARGKHGLVYDLMEPLRPITDRIVLKFIQTHIFHPADFVIRDDGLCRLNPEMAKSVVRLLHDLQEPDFDRLLS